ncbi:glutathione S-transferase family protein [Pseudooceanicola sp.]|uniref:glutathione S-transferase family protein n=1 Tax=Pseudooceanicola sp. TaxID=1914328 RepID=UPI0035C6C1BF
MIRLWGFRYSVYTWIARMALAERGLAYDWSEVNPFDPEAENPHPFGRVPLLDHDGARIFETAAITTYLDEAFPGDSWTPDAPLSRSRVTQVIGMVDSYGYWPMVRDVFGPAVFAPATGRAPDQERIDGGLRDSLPVLDALEEIAAEGVVLNGALTRADLHLAPMVGYFAAHPPAAELLGERPCLSAWFSQIRQRPSYLDTQPGLPENSL